MNPERNTGDVQLHHCLDAAFQCSGGKIDLDTPSGPMTMTLPPGLSDGQTLRLGGCGELGPDGKRGDVLLTVSFFSIHGEPAVEEPVKEAAVPPFKQAQAGPPVASADFAAPIATQPSAPLHVEPRVVPVQVQDTHPAASVTASESDSAQPPASPPWISERGRIDLGVFASLCVLGMAFFEAAKPTDFPFYIVLALAVPCLCQIAFIIDSQCVPPGRLRIEALRIVRIILFTSLVSGLYGADKQDQWPFKDTSGHIYKRVIGEGVVRDYAAESNPIHRRARAFEPLVTFFFFGLLIPLSPLILFAMLADRGPLKNRDLRMFGLSWEQDELERAAAPLQDPDFGRLEWSREEHQWQGRVPCSFGGDFDLTIARCLTAGAPPPSAEQRKELLAALGRMDELRAEAARQFQSYLSDDDDDMEFEEDETPPPKPATAPKAAPAYSLEQVIRSITPHSLRVSASADVVSPSFVTHLSDGYVMWLEITQDDVECHFTYAA